MTVPPPHVCEGCGDGDETVERREQCCATCFAYSEVEMNCRRRLARRTGEYAA